MDRLQLRQADKIEIVVLVDNYSDELLEDSETIKRLRVLSPNAPMAEPGLSLMVKVYAGTEEHTVLMDTGISGKCLKHNTELLETSKAVLHGVVTADVNAVESVVISHGHSDHFGGLMTFLLSAGKKMPVILHPSAFVERRLKHGNDYSDMVSLDESILEQAGALLDKRSDPSTIASDLILVSGKIERITGFEKGTSSLEAKIGGNWMPDPFYDDQALAIHIKNHGLVVLAGCSHAGAINTVRHVCKIAGTNKIHAIMGGFHLPGPDKSIAEFTIAEMKKIAPDFIIPMHCTGWNAINRFSVEMPEQFILNSVGTTYLFPFDKESTNKSQ
ncbi:MBL fold metallo-hydrolase [Desulfococcaceae bacterium HSG7]|nr:MBL fold metallo-hydrolase [Desulfococcaceae bacterium HSG7]